MSRRTPDHVRAEILRLRAQDCLTMGALFDDPNHGAVLSSCGRYRYDLWRRWDDGPLMGWIMLNPSTADAEANDSTIRRCIGFARREDFAGIVVRNLYARRTPYPKALLELAAAGEDIIGPDNDEWLRELAADRFRVQMVVAAWGASATYERVRIVEEMFGDRLMRLDNSDWVFGGTLAPHPLFLPADTPFSPCYAPQR